MHIVYLSLGTNLGNRKRNLREAIEKIGELVGIILRQSAIYETKPWGFDSPNDFLNICVCVETPLLPRQLLEATQRVERELGRTTKSISRQYVDRIIDIDILLYDCLRIDEADLHIPHPLMAKRDFVLMPLREVWRPNCGVSTLEEAMDAL